MRGSTTLRRPWHQHRVLRSLIIPVIVYVGLEIPVAIANRDAMNPDGLSYIQLATHLAEGRYADSVSGYWSPLFIWCIAPLRYLGMDGLHAARVVQAIWGLLCVIAGAIFLRRFTHLRFPWDTATLTVFALIVMMWSTTFISPDLILATLLIGYCACTSSRQLLRHRSYQLSAGLLGGVAYLAKAYGLPFFLAHFTLVLALHFWRTRHSASRWNAVRAWGVGMLGFGLVAGPWIGVLSHHYGKWTFSTTARIAHTIVGPPIASPEETRRHPIHRLYTLPAGVLSTWERPDEMMEYHHWSPFESWTFFKHQIHRMNLNRQRIFDDIKGFDPLGLCLMGFVLFPLSILATRRRAGTGKYLWLLGTVGIFAGGFLPVCYFGLRYIMPFVWFMCCVQFVVAWVWMRRVILRPGSATSSSVRWSWRILTAVCFWSLASPSYSYVQRALLPGQGTTFNTRDLAAQLHQDGCEGPVAVTSTEHWSFGLYVSHLMSEPFSGVVRAKALSDVQAQLAKHNIQTLLVDLKWRHAKTWRFDKDIPWELKRRIPRGSNPIFVFVPKQQASGASQPSDGSE